jgi:hypothetical protein
MAPAPSTGAAAQEIKMSMNSQERQVIHSLFTRLGEVESKAPARDAEAEAFIQERIRQQPGAPYFMAQTIVMQEYALQQAQQQIEELERRAVQRPAGGGLFSNLFGGGQNSSGSGTSVVGGSRNIASRDNATPLAQPGRGGGFLAGAAQTAMGVAGGVLLGNAIAGMFGGNEAHADEPAQGADEEAAGNEETDEGGESLESDFGDDEMF